MSSHDDSLVPTVPDAALAGVLLLLAGGVSLLGIITAEALHPDYATTQEISDLGSTIPPDPVSYEPTATIFNATMITTGVLVLLSAVFLYRSGARRVLSVPLAVFGAGVLGVGVFPGDVMPWHGIAALVTFTSGGIAAVLASRAVSKPFAYLCLLLGGFSLASLVYAIAIGPTGPLGDLEAGGIERWVAYPLLVWISGYGGYLMGATGDDPVRGRSRQ